MKKIKKTYEYEIINIDDGRRLVEYELSIVDNGCPKAVFTFNNKERIIIFCEFDLEDKIFKPFQASFFPDKNSIINRSHVAYMLEWNDAFLFLSEMTDIFIEDASGLFNFFESSMTLAFMDDIYSLTSHLGEYQRSSWLESISRNKKGDGGA